MKPSMTCTGIKHFLGQNYKCTEPAVAWFMHASTTSGPDGWTISRCECHANEVRQSQNPDIREITYEEAVVFHVMKS